jgi:hypothetical protein
MTRLGLTERRTFVVYGTSEPGDRATMTAVAKSKGTKVHTKAATAAKSAKKTVVRRATGRVHTKTAAVKAIKK